MKGKSGRMGPNAIKVFVSIFVCVIALPVLAEIDAPATAFVKKVKGAGEFETAIQTTDGGYVSVSRLDDNKYTSYIVRKISKVGKRVWERKLRFQVGADLGDGFVFINGIAEINNGYVLVGWGRLGGYYSDGTAVLVELRTNGTVRWSKTFGRPAAKEISFDSVSSTADGGYIVRGATFQPSGTILVKFTSSGQILWSRSFNELIDNSLSQPVSDGLILAFEHFDDCDPSCEESADLFVLKVNDSGLVVWTEELKIEGFHLHTLGSASDNRVVLAGKSSNSNTLILIGLNAKGELQWRASYSLKVPSFSVSSLVGTSDLGYLITGTRFNPKSGGDKGGFVLRIDAKQNLVFQKTFGLSDTNENAESVLATAEGGFTVFGSSGLNDMLVLNLNSDGVMPGCRFFHKLSVNKVVSPNVKSNSLQFTSSNDFSLPTPGTIHVDSVVSGKSSSNICP